MDKKEIIEALEKNNKWWKWEFELDFKRRKVYDEIKKFMHTRQIISLTGLRRVGKTQTMLKIVQDNIEKYDKKNILYFSFDEFKDVKIYDIMRSYARLMSRDLDKGSYLMLFDEIQKIDNWEEQLKRIYDENPKIKFIISGSESLFIRKKTRESLAGRIYEFQIKTLDFEEYLAFKNKKFDNLPLYKEEILREFNNFLFCSGFPEIINETKEISNKYIKDNVIDKVIFKDLPQIISIKEPAIMEELFKIILNNPGGTIDVNDLSQNLNISRQTISLYLYYLEKSFLIKKIFNFSRNARKTQRKLKKYYPTIFSIDVLENKELFGRVFETFIVNQLNAEFFWRDPYKNEVDIIKIEEDKILPIEIKSSEIDIKPMKIFMKKFKIERGVIVSYDKKEKVNGIEIIPFYEFLLEK